MDGPPQPAPGSHDGKEQGHRTDEEADESPNLAWGGEGKADVVPARGDPNCLKDAVEGAHRRAVSVDRGCPPGQVRLPPDERVRPRAVDACVRPAGARYRATAGQVRSRAREMVDPGCRRAIDEREGRA